MLEDALSPKVSLHLEQVHYAFFSVLFLYSLVSFHSSHDWHSEFVGAQVECG